MCMIIYVFLSYTWFYVYAWHIDMSYLLPYTYIILYRIDLSYVFFIYMLYMLIFILFQKFYIIVHNLHVKSYINFVIYTSLTS